MVRPHAKREEEEELQHTKTRLGRDDKKAKERKEEKKSEV